MKIFLLFILCTNIIYAQNNSKPISPKNQLKSKKEEPAKKLIPPSEDEDSEEEKKEDGKNAISSKKYLDEKNDEDDSKIFEITLETASDFIFRGNSFGGEALSQRDNTYYKSFSQAYAFQPTIDVNTPIKGLNVEFWFNLFLTGSSDRDSDKRFLQYAPGSPDLYRFFQNSLSNGILNFDTRYIRPYKEENGLRRDHGIEVTPEYEFQNHKYGTFTTGIFTYNTFVPHDQFSWTQIFTTWKPNTLSRLEPKISIYKTVLNLDDSTSTGINKGSAYTSFELGHEFFKNKFFRIAIHSSVGYIYQNNPQNKNSGISDITSTIKFNAGNFFFTGNHVNRPDTYLYSNNYYFDNSVRFLKDGNTNDPSKTSGLYNQFIFDQIKNFSPNEFAYLYTKDKYESHKVLRNLLYFTFGYSFEI